MDSIFPWEMESYHPEEWDLPLFIDDEEEKEKIASPLSSSLQDDIHSLLSDEVLTQEGQTQESSEGPSALGRATSDRSEEAEASESETEQCVRIQRELWDHRTKIEMDFLLPDSNLSVFMHRIFQVGEPKGVFEWGGGRGHNLPLYGEMRMPFYVMDYSAVAVSIAQKQSLYSLQGKIRQKDIFDPWPSMIHQLGVPLGLIVDIRCATYYPKEEVQQLVTQAWMVLPKQAWYFGKFWGHGTVREFYGIEPCYYHPYELTHMFRSFHQADLMKITTEVSRRGEIDVEWVVIAQR
jgi:hypothetical protein